VAGTLSGAAPVASLNVSLGFFCPLSKGQSLKEVSMLVLELWKRRNSAKLCENID
jgi:hypothetical protein